MRALLLLLLFCSCLPTLSGSGRPKPNYGDEYDNALIGQWSATDFSKATFTFEEGEGTSNLFRHEFVWKSKGNKITYSTFCYGGLFQDDYWSEDRYMTYTIKDSILTINVLENEFAPEGEPVPGTYTLKKDQ